MSLGEPAILLLGLVVLMPLLKGSAVPGHGEIWLGTSIGRDDWAGLDRGRPRRLVPWKPLDAGSASTP